MVIKLSTSVGSATPDPAAGSAATLPVPQTTIENKPAPGQKGPKGMGPRQTFSRVNTGVPPTPDVGGSAQKSMAPRGAEFLPQKMASAEVYMTTTARPSLNDMIKAAMQGTIDQVDVTAEAARQLVHQGINDEVKTASVSQAPSHIPTDHVEKLAEAIDYIAMTISKEAEGTNSVQVGEGPGALKVLQATSNGPNIDAGQLGTASGTNLPPKNPSTQAEKVQSGASGTGLETNDSMMHAEQPIEPISNQKASIAASPGDKTVTAAANMQRLLKIAKPTAKPRTDTSDINPLKAGLLGAAAGLAASAALPVGLGAYHGAQRGRARGLSEKQHALHGGISAGGGALLGGTVGGLAAAVLGAPPVGVTAGGVAGSYIGGTRAYASAMKNLYPKSRGPKSKSMVSSAPLQYIRKLAADAENPAKITASSASTPEASASESAVPSQPSDVTSQAKLVSSNLAAIGYTKGQAKKDPISDVGQLLKETPMKDPVLNKVLNNASSAGIKTSQAQDTMKVAAARALLTKLAAEVDGEKRAKPRGKEKESMMGGGVGGSSQAARGGTPAGVQQPQFTQ